MGPFSGKIEIGHSKPLLCFTKIISVTIWPLISRQVPQESLL